MDNPVDLIAKAFVALFLFLSSLVLVDIRNDLRRIASASERAELNIAYLAGRTQAEREMRGR